MARKPSNSLTCSSPFPAILRAQRSPGALLRLWGWICPLGLQNGPYCGALSGLRKRCATFHPKRWLNAPGSRPGWPARPSARKLRRSSTPTTHATRFGVNAARAAVFSHDTRRRVGRSDALPLCYCGGLLAARSPNLPQDEPAVRRAVVSADGAAGAHETRSQRTIPPSQHLERTTMKPTDALFSEAEMPQSQLAVAQPTPLELMREVIRVG